jgi:hypothetical protein
VTASQIIERPSHVRDYIGARVCRDAAATIARLDVARLLPVKRTAAAFGVAMSCWIAGVLLLGGRPSAMSGLTLIPGATIDIVHVDAVVTPPAYSGRSAQTLRDPARLTTLAGSRVQLTISAAAETIAFETITGRQTLRPTAARTFSGELIADADGFIALEPLGADGQRGMRRLIGLSVDDDQPPRVRVTAPGKDLFLPDPKRAIDLAIEADDDIGLSSLVVRYTRVAGSGENFTFTDGEVPLDITRTSGQAWTATGVLRLAALELAPGDMIVYRAVATDARPGASPTESDSWVVEIIAPGAVAMEGFAVDDEQDRYALSQQMVIIKTEQLIARKATLSSDAFVDQAQNLAAEQRRVRAEFVFMMGGELAEAGVDIEQLHEEEEAAGEHDLAAGRLANQGRADLIRAIRSMSLAATSLVAAELPTALADEKAALAALQRAFARSRYILRTLTERERLDLSRRLTGELAALVRDSRPAATPVDNPRVAELRRSLAGLAAIAGARRIAAAAQDLLRIDPASDALAQVAARLTDAATALAADRLRDARPSLDRATLDLAAVVRAELLDAPRRRATPDAAQLEGLLGDALRRRVR